MDFGDLILQCNYCGDFVWYEERSEKTRSSANPQFSICCMKGKIQLLLLQRPLELLFNLMHGFDTRSSHFLQYIRQYNNMFSFTSIGGKIDTSMNRGGGPPQFVLHGQNFHKIGSLLPNGSQHPKFSQLYIYDTENEISNRMHPFRYFCLNYFILF